MKYITPGWFFQFSNILEREVVSHKVQQPASPEHHLSTQVGLTSVWVKKKKKKTINESAVQHTQPVLFQAMDRGR